MGASGSGLGISRETVYAYLRAESETSSSVDAAGEAGLATVLSSLPADRRPTPSVAEYDDLLRSRAASGGPAE
jgi:hypothetical protein